MNGKNSLPVLTVGVLITGNIVGAGILGLPINTGLAGFSLSTLTMFAMCGLMVGTALILSGRVLETREDRFDLPSLYGQALGKGGKWAAILANLLILYGLLVAYLSGGTTILIRLLHVSIPAPVMTIIFFCFTAGLTLFGLAVVRKGNALLMIVMWVAFAILIAIAGTKIRAERLTFIDWTLLPSAIPIMVTAFHFHNILPTVCRTLEYDPAAVRKAIFLGGGLGLLMNLLWNVVAIGGIPVTGQGTNTILYASQHGLPATVPLTNILNSKIFGFFGMLFAILAITTSFLANGTALMSFVQDMCAGLFKNRSRILQAILTFAPPLIVTLVYPHLFLKALDVVGGVGIALLFGILPGILLIRRAGSGWRRFAGYLILFSFIAVLIFEICKESGLLTIDPGAELWKAGLMVGK